MASKAVEVEDNSGVGGLRGVPLRFLERESKVQQNEFLLAKRAERFISDMN